MPRIVPLRQQYQAAQPSVSAHDAFWSCTEPQFRELCARRWQSPDTRNQPRLSTIGAVGAWTFEFDGHDSDSVLLTQSLRTMLGAGLAIDPDFTVDLITLPRDFLKEKERYDVVALCYIPRYDPSGFPPGAFHTYHAQPLKLEESFNYVSPHHSGAAFRSRIEQAAARLVIVSGGRRTEIETSALAGGTFKTLIPSPACFYTRQPGYLAHTEFIAAYKENGGSGLNHKEALGQALLKTGTPGWFERMRERITGLHDSQNRQFS